MHIGGVATAAFALELKMTTFTDLRQGVECVLLGIKDSIVGVWPVFRLIKQ